jgi:uncharacterized protein
MAKLKALPKALIVGAIIAAVGFSAYKFMPVKQENESPESSTNVNAIRQIRNPSPVNAPIDSTEQLRADIMDAEPEPVVSSRLGGAGIASGQKTGTNYPMVEDIIKVCSRDDYPLRNVITNGSVDNINKIYSDKNSQFGIIQEDALDYQRKIDPKMMSRVVAVFPFFSVEVHAIAKNGAPINSLADMAGKRVVEGPEGSGTWVTVQLIKQMTGIKWETVEGNLSQKDGLAAVQRGDADVEFIVAGQPITVLTTAKGIKLIPLNNPTLDKYAFYTKAQLPTGTYGFQQGPVSTYKVNNVLATFAYKNQYQKEIGALVSCITKHVGDLQADGHPKWRDVDPLDIERVKWNVHPAALAAIKREAKAR